MKSQIAQGIKIESEHSATYRKLKNYFKKKGKFPSSKTFFKMIASDHIEKENPKYYTLLKRAGL